MKVFLDSHIHFILETFCFYLTGVPTNSFMSVLGVYRWLSEWYLIWYI